MKRNFQKLLAALSFLILTGFCLNTEASHFQGSELTYTCIAPNVYVVDLKLYRDCTGAGAPTGATLKLNSPGCNSGRTLAMTKVGNTRVGDLYCPLLGAPSCTMTGNPNFEEVIFTATLTFTAAEAQCQNWLLSWSECCRPSAANIIGQAAFYTEAFINLGTPSSRINNSSPKFQSIVVPYVNKFKPVKLSSLALDPDGDSLVYSFQAPKADYSTFISYGQVNASTQMIIRNPADTTQIAFYAGTLPQHYSPALPMISYMVDWNGPATVPYPPSPTGFTWAATLGFNLNPNSGELTFTPSVYRPGATSASGENKYVVVVQVDEYRKINGMPVKVGSVRRDMFITVVDCGANQNPEVSALVANGQPLTNGAIINLRPGTPLNFTFTAADNNANDVLSMDSDAGAILPGAVFMKTTGARPTGTITWTPTAAHVRGQVYYFTVTVTDNACPVKGQQVQTFGVRVSNTGGVTGLGKNISPELALAAYPNPFSGEVTFRVKQTQPRQHLLIYNVLGRQVDQILLKGIQGTEQEVSWSNAAKFPAGQYIVRISSSGQSLKVHKLQ